jgi:hypothetical protein
VLSLVLVDPVQLLESGDFSGDGHWQPGGVKQGDAANAAFPLEDSATEFFDAHAIRADHAQSSNDGSFSHSPI